MAAINIDVGANTRQAEKDIQKLVNKNYTINLKTKGSQPLGRITGEVNEFTKSLDASNARVIAFGASAGIIFGVQRAFQALVSSTIEVQKSLQDINVILNVSTQQLNKFGSELFNIARNTGQSFGEVAKAATEFSRQGLGLEETLKRTSDALILSRLSGLDAAKSVDALTAAVNSFASQAATTTEIVNKFANVDAAFAVSSQDLAEAISRVGSSAAQSGVSLNELIAIVTSAQQTTARGGAVIGNSFKTIFTRLQRGKVVNLLESLGVDSTDASGNIKSTIQLLQDLAKVYDNLGTLQQADVAEKVGGVFQINILKAALADLGKEYSTYNSALQVASGSTDQAIKRNEELNKTYAAQLNALAENAKQLGGNVGTRLLGPVFDRTVGNANEIFKGINASDGQGIGATLGKGILDGLGQVIAGPGLALIGGVFIKLFADFSKYASGSVKDLLGLNNATKQQADLQKSVNEILSRNPALIQQMGQGTAGVNKLAETLLNTLRAQTTELQKQQQIAGQVSAILAKGGVKIVGGVPTAPTPGKPGKAAGYIPNFASNKLIEKYTAISLGATSSVRPHMSKGTIGGKKFVMNNQEVEFPGVGKNGDSMVIPMYGDGPRIAAAGFIPNFAGGAKINADFTKLDRKQFIGRYGKSEYQGRIDAAKQGIPYSVYQQHLTKQKSEKQQQKELQKEITRRGVLNSSNQYAVIVASGPQFQEIPINNFLPTSKALKTYTDRGLDPQKMSFLQGSFTVHGLEKTADEPEKSKFENIVRKNVDIAGRDITTYVSQAFEGKGEVQSQGLGSKYKDQISALAGFLFEDVVSAFLPGPEFDAYSDLPANARFDFPGASPTLKNLFNIKGNPAGIEAKLNAGSNLLSNPANSSSVANKIYSILGANQPNALKKSKKNKAAGFIPNFSVTSEAAKRALKTENMMGGRGVLDYEKGLGPYVRDGKTQPNFAAVKRDHPEGLKTAIQNSARSQKIASRGFIPNFAEGFDAETSETAGLEQASASLTSTISALAIQLSSLVFTFQLTKDEYRKSIKDLTESNKKAGKAAPGGLEKAKAFAGTNALGLTFAAPIIGQTLAPFAKQFATERFGGQAGRATEAGITGGTNALALTAGASLLTKNPKILGLTALAATAFGLIDVFKQLNTSLPELTEASQKASSSFTQFTEAAGRIRSGAERVQDLRVSGDVRGAATEQLKLEEELLKIDFKTPELQAQAISSIRDLNFKSLETALNENTQALLKQKEETELSEKITTDIESGNFKEVGKTLFQSAQREVLREQLKTGKREDFDFTGYTSNIEKVISDVNRLSQRGNPSEGRDQLKANILTQVDQIPGLDNLSEQFKKGDINPKEFIKSLKEAVAEAKNIAKTEADIAKRMGEGNPLIDNLKNALNNGRTEFEKFVANTKLSTGLQAELNNIIKKASNAIKQNELSTQADILETYGNKDLALQASIESEVFEITSAATEANTAALSALNNFLTGAQETKTISGFQPEVFKTLEENQKALEGGLSSSIQNLDEFIRMRGGQGIVTPETIKEKSADQLAEELKGQFPEIDITELTNLVNQVYSTAQEQKVTQEQQLRILAQNKTAEAIKQLIQATQKAFGGLEGFKAVGDQDPFRENLLDLQEGLGDLKSIRSDQSPTVESGIEAGRASLKVLDAVAAITGRSTQDIINKEGAGFLKENVMSGMVTELEQQILSTLTSFEALGDGSDQLRSLFLGLLKEQTGVDLINVSGEELAARLQEAAQKIAGIRIGDEKTAQPIISGIRQAVIDSFETLENVNPKFIESLREQGNPVLENVQDALFIETQNQTTILTDIRNSLQKLPQISGNPSTSTNTEPVSTNARGFIPSMAKESADIKKGVGGARPTDYPMFMPNLNGSPAVINSGEKLIPNFANTGQTAVLTREMQKTMNMAKGFIPNFAPPIKPADLAYIKRMEKAMGSAAKNKNSINILKRIIPYLGTAITGYLSYKKYNEMLGNNMDPTEAIVRAGLEVGGAGLGGLTGLVAGGGLASVVTGTLGALGGQQLGSVVGDLIYGPKNDMDFSNIEPAAKPAAKPATKPAPKPAAKSAAEEKKSVKKLEEIKEDKQKEVKEKEDKAKQRANELRNNMLRYEMGAEARFKQYNPDGEYTGVTDIYGPGGGGYEKDSVIAATKSDLAKRIQELKQRREEAKGFPGSDEVAVGISRQILSLQGQLNKTLRESRASQYRGSVIEGSAVKTYAKELPFRGTSIKNPSNVQRIVTDSTGKVVGFSRNLSNEPEVAAAIAAKKSVSEIEAATIKARNRLSPSISMPEIPSVLDIANTTTNRGQQIQSPPPSVKSPSPVKIIEEQLSRAATISAGFATDLGINIGEQGKKVFGAEGRKPEVQIGNSKSPETAFVEFRSNRNPLVSFSGRPSVDTLFNEATNLNQSQKQGTALPEQFQLFNDAIKKSGGFNSIDKRQREITDFIIAQNQSAKTPFTEIGSNIPLDKDPKKDTRQLGGITSEYNISDVRSDKPAYLAERSSTLMGILSKGISAGEISSEELETGLGIKREQAAQYVKEIQDIDKKLKEVQTFSKGFIPNFAPKLDPKQLKDAVEAEKRQAPPGAVPALAFHRGNPTQPYIYDSRTQTEESALRDHGGYKQGYRESKARRGDDSFGKNMVANLAYNKENNRNKNTSPVFNINFSPQNTTNYSEGFVPNFASENSVDYEKMINDMRSDMEKRWQQAVQPMKEVISAGQRKGTVPYNKPKFTSTSLKF
jgi:TP901 family phage tail tape measure protein